MTEVASTLAAAEGFETADTGFRVTAATFDATVVPGSASVTVSVVLPTIDAVTEDSVATVVVDGWYETLARRLEGVASVTDASVEEPAIERFSEEVLVEIKMEARETAVASDVRAVVNFVEGTWVGGIIPGYAYEDRVQALRSAAAEAGGSEDTNPEPD